MAERPARPPNPVVQLTLMRLREMAREPGVLFWVFGFPVLLAIALGVAFRARGPEPVVVGALPGIGSEVRRALAAARVQVKDLDADSAARELRAGRVSLLLLPPAGPEGELGFRFDPARAEARTARAVVNAAVQRAAGQTEPLAVADHEVHEPGSRYIDFLVPGLVAMNLMSGSMWGVAWVIVHMRTRKLLKRFLAAPMKRRHLLYALGLARLLVIPAELLVILAFARVFFSVQVTGSYLALFAVAVAGSASFAAIAIAAASRAQNTETVSGLMNLITMPMFVVSGVFFAYSNFPEALQPVIRALPLTAMCDGMRTVMIDGAGLVDVLPSLVVLALWGVPAFALGLRYFRWS
ncbi:MAG: ABC transporter permease [Deltaproteobacteria bacterium]|jgi:ABC-2 type transport system permease protein|nr:ABC transporter permease [Deltaproteobacteria bacterium]